MNREELEDLKITKISEEEYERLKDSDEGEAMEVSIDSLKAEQEKLKESASLLDEAKKAFSAYWFLLSLFVGQNLCLGVVLCQIYSAWSKGEPLGFMVLCAISIIVAASYSWNAQDHIENDIRTINKFALLIVVWLKLIELCWNYWNM